MPYRGRASRPWFCVSLAERARCLRFYTPAYAAIMANRDLLNVRYLLKPASAPEPGAVYQDSAWNLYENPRAFPRAWLVHDILTHAPDTPTIRAAQPWSGAISGSSSIRRPARMRSRSPRLRRTTWHWRYMRRVRAAGAERDFLSWLARRGEWHRPAHLPREWRSPRYHKFRRGTAALSWTTGRSPSTTERSSACWLSAERRDCASPSLAVKLSGICSMLPG
jgi:hypothetical protein